MSQSMRYQSLGERSGSGQRPLFNAKQRCKVLTGDVAGRIDAWGTVRQLLRG